MVREGRLKQFPNNIFGYTKTAYKKVIAGTACNKGGTAESAFSVKQSGKETSLHCLVSSSRS